MRVLDFVVVVVVWGARQTPTILECSSLTM